MSQPRSAHVQAPSSSSGSSPRSSRAPGRKVRLFLLGVAFVAFTTVNATLSLSGHHLVGSAFGAAALCSLGVLIAVARKGGR